MNDQPRQYLSPDPFDRVMGMLDQRADVTSTKPTGPPPTPLPDRLAALPAAEKGKVMR